MATMIEPMKDELPNTINKINPITVGGKTMGSKNNVSSNIFPLKSRFDIKNAAIVPNIKTTSIAINATCSDSMTGVKNSVAVIPKLSSSESIFIKHLERNISL